MPPPAAMPKRSSRSARLNHAGCSVSCDASPTASLVVVQVASHRQGNALGFVACFINRRREKVEIDLHSLNASNGALAAGGGNVHAARNGNLVPVLIKKGKQVFTSLGGRQHVVYFGKGRRSRRLGERIS